MGQGIAWNTIIDQSYVSQYVDYARGCHLVSDEQTKPNDGEKQTPKQRRIVSIGSGSGVYESKIEDDLKCNIICVDPEPYSFAPRPDKTKGEKGHAPDYLTVQDLIMADKTIVGDCDMIIIWSTPNGSTYDMEAITLLQPITVTVVYESTGSAGSIYLHKWIDESGGPQISELQKSIEAPMIPNPFHTYRTPACYVKKHYSDHDSFAYTLILMTRSDVVPRPMTIPTGVIDDNRPTAHAGNAVDQLQQVISKADGANENVDEAMSLLLMQMLKMTNRR